MKHIDWDAEMVYQVIGVVVHVKVTCIVVSDASGGINQSSDPLRGRGRGLGRRLGRGLGRGLDVDAVIWTGARAINNEVTIFSRARSARDGKGERHHCPSPERDDPRRPRESRGALPRASVPW